MVADIHHKAELLHLGLFRDLTTLPACISRMKHTSGGLKEISTVLLTYDTGMQWH